MNLELNRDIWTKILESLAYRWHLGHETNVGREEKKAHGWALDNNSVKKVQRRGIINKSDWEGAVREG